jgi:hypothetical protein
VPSRWGRLFLAVMLLSMTVPASAPARAQSADCEAFDSQIWAQSVYDTNPT